MKKYLKYKYLILLFCLLLAILSFLICYNFNEKLNRYEIYDIDNYLSSTIKKMQDKDFLSKYIFDKNVSNNYERDVSTLNSYISYLKDNDIKYLKIDENVYELSYNEKRFGVISLKKGKEENILGLLSYNDMDIDNIVLDEGIYNFDLYVNDSYTVYINGNLISENDLVGINEFDSVTIDLYGIPKIKHYLIKDLYNIPSIKILNSFGQEVTYKIDDNKIIVDNYIVCNDISDGKKYFAYDFDPLMVAKKWSLYLSSDLYGKRGFYELKPYLLKGTDLYTRAYNWSVNYDIYFTSSHVLSDKPFTNVIYNNFVIYSVDFFSVDISFDKNMILSNGDNKVDKLSETFYFLNSDGGYKLVDMRTIHD